MTPDCPGHRRPGQSDLWEVYPPPDRLTRDAAPSLCLGLRDNPVGERELKMKPDPMQDDLRRDQVTARDRLRIRST
jgi:hypothetical protein